MKKKAEPTYKIVVVGPEGTGKTTLVNTIRGGSADFSPQPTTTMDTSSHIITTATGKKLMCHFWDTAGQERYKGLGNMYYRNSFVCLAVADVSEPDTIERLGDYIEMYEKENTEDSIIIIVLNKVDLVEQDEVLELIEQANEYGRDVFPTSALNNVGVDELVQNMAEKIMSRVTSSDEAEEVKETQDITVNAEPEKKKCC